MGESDHVRVLLASNSEMFKDDVSIKLVKRFGNVEIFRATTFEETLNHISAQKTDILIIGKVTLGYEVEDRVTKLYQAQPGLKILCFCGNFCPKQYGVRLFRAGVNGVFLDLPDERKVDECVSRILDGRISFPELVDEAIRNREYLFYPDQVGCLTDREMTVLQYMLEGKSLKDACDEMNIAKGTMSSMRSRVQRKLGADNYAEVVLLSFQYGLMDKTLSIGETITW